MLKLSESGMQVLIAPCISPLTGSQMHLMLKKIQIERTAMEGSHFTLCDVTHS